jgi:hypothetical protein
MLNKLAARNGRSVGNMTRLLIRYGAEHVTGTEAGWNGAMTEGRAA